VAGSGGRRVALAAAARHLRGWRLPSVKGRAVVTAFSANRRVCRAALPWQSGVVGWVVTVMTVRMEKQFAKSTAREQRGPPNASGLKMDMGGFDFLLGAAIMIAAGWLFARWLSER
jgi:hypothetical protein